MDFQCVMPLAKDDTESEDKRFKQTKMLFWIAGSKELLWFWVNDL